MGKLRLSIQNAMKQSVRNFLLFFICFCALPQFVAAQVEIAGKVIDKTTGEAIPYCNIASATSSLGTASNELGEFIVSMDSLPGKLIFSHIGYGQQIVTVSQVSEVSVSLQPLVSNLDEVVVLATKKDGFAKNLVKKAYEKANNALGKQYYGKALYRQKSKNGDDYSEFSEIFYDLRYNSTGIADWNIEEGRYALKDDAVYNRNYTLFSRILRPLQPNTTELIFPMHPSFEVYYDLKVTEMIQDGSTKIAVVRFKPQSTIKTPIFEGAVLINTVTHDILKIHGTITRDDLKLSKLNTKKGYWKDYTISYEITYTKDDNGSPLLDYIKVDQEFDYFKDDTLQYHTTTTSNLTFYEHYSPTSKRRLGARIIRNQSDWENLDEIGYNERFWANNPIIKRTHVEEEVISSFEKDNAFNSIFLNSAENIALLEANLAEDPFIKNFTSSLNDYNNYNPIEKIYLQTDRDLFSAGELLWFSAYGVIGPFHEFTMASRVLHIDLVAPNNKVVLSQTHELDKGRSAGSIELPKNLYSGNYQLRAYTQWMRNFDTDFLFTKKIKILNTSGKTAPNSATESKLDLQFFPEGGHAVVGIASKIAFKAIGNDGLPQKVTGKVLDSEDKPVAILNTLDRGAGFFQLMPKKGVQYEAVLDDGTRYPLPEILENGYTVSVNNLNEKSIKVIVQASPALRENPFYAIGHIRQRKYYQGKFEFGESQILTFEIPKNNMPSGVLTLTLFDANKKPRSERAVFVNNQEELVISTKIDNKKFEKRAKVKMDVKVTDTYGRPITTNLSIAVTDNGQVQKDEASTTILSHLLLQSDIKGEVTDPGLLFMDQKRTTLNQLDLVMLTHGWRKFPWQELWNGVNIKKDFEFSKGLRVSGTAEGKYGKPLPNATLNVVAKSGDQLGMYTAKTAVGGKFSIPDFNFNDSTQIAIHAFDAKDRAVDVKVNLDKQKPITPPAPQFKSPALAQTDDTKNYLDIANSRKRFNSLYNFDEINMLEEVVVTEKKIEGPRNTRASNYGVTPDATVYTKDYIAMQTVLQLVSLFAGVSVNGTTVSIRNQGTPLWVLDGIPVYNDNPSASTVARANQRASRAGGGSGALSLSVEQSLAAAPAPTFITTMDALTVERIEILKGARAAIYGSRSANGVILIYTKRGEGTPPIISGDFTIMGHAAAREFYSPKYDVKIAAHEKPDYRATLYWNHSFTTDNEGKASIEFFNSDSAKSIQVAIEGLSTLGVPGAYLETFGDKE
mgnify:CR=1 FL=1